MAYSVKAGMAVDIHHQRNVIQAATCHVVSAIFRTTLADMNRS